MKMEKYTVITGASSGIGRAAAKAFAGRGRNLILTARRRGRLDQLRAELLAAYPSLSVEVMAADLSEAGQAEEFYRGLKGYKLETFINNAGVGSYGSVGARPLAETEQMLRLNVEALTVLSTLYVQDYRNVPGAQLINVSSCGGYTLVPAAVTYCAAKFYVSAFTEGLARELLESGAALRAKVLAPAATATEFGMRANHTEHYDYDQAFGRYHTSDEMAACLLRLYDSTCTVGFIDRETFEFSLREPMLPYAGGSAHNQKPPFSGEAAGLTSRRNTLPE